MIRVTLLITEQAEYLATKVNRMSSFVNKWKSSTGECPTRGEDDNFLGRLSEGAQEAIDQRALVR